MTTQERIAQLAQAALRSGPPVATPPKPATFMPTFDLPAPQAPIAATTPPLAAMPVPETIEEVQPVYKDTEDPELRALLEEKEARMKKNLTRQRRMVNILALLVMAGGWGWYATSPSAQAQVAALMPALRQSIGDFKLMASGTKQYDKSLEKVAEHGSQIDAATRAMGGDPKSVRKDEDPQMENEMKQLMGADARTTGDRNRELQSKFGMIGNLIGGGKKPAPKADEAAAAPAGQ